MGKDFRRCIYVLAAHQPLDDFDAKKQISGTHCLGAQQIIQPKQLSNCVT